MQKSEWALMVGGAGSFIVALGLQASGFQNVWIGGSIGALGVVLWMIAGTLWLRHKAPDASAEDARRPEVVALLDVQPVNSEYFGPIEIHNSGDLDAFNIDISDISNGNGTARFGRITHLKAGDNTSIVPLIDNASETRSGIPNLYAFAWRGQLSNAWHAIAEDPNEVPKEAIDELVRKTFVAPFTIAFDDVKGRTWLTQQELVFGTDRADQPRLVIEFRGIKKYVRETNS